MTLKEMKKKVLGLIEELNPLSEYLTDDPDIATKINDVINHIMFELARFKKIPKYIEMEVEEGEILEFADIEEVLGYEIYQIDIICGVRYVPKANGTVLKMLETGTAEVSCFVYPERITPSTKDSAYEFELSPDVLEVMPFGVAGDLLKSDVSTEYGAVYSNRYNEMLQRLDHRYAMPTMFIEGGLDV
jgi:hypothetical protein